MFSKSLQSKSGWQEVEKYSTKFFALSLKKKTYELAKIGNEVLVILKRRDVNDCRTKSGSWRNGRLLAYLSKDILLFKFPLRKYVWLTLSVLKIQRTTYYNKASSNDTENCTEFLF